MIRHLQWLSLTYLIKIMSVRLRRMKTKRWICGSMTAGQSLWFIFSVFCKSKAGKIWQQIVRKTSRLHEVAAFYPPSSFNLSFIIHAGFCTLCVNPSTVICILVVLLFVCCDLIGSLHRFSVIMYSCILLIPGVSPQNVAFGRALPVRGTAIPEIFYLFILIKKKKKHT